MENYNEYRRSSRAVRVGREGTAALTVGGIATVSVQTMLNVPTDDLGACLSQALRLQTAGAQIIRVTVPTPANAAVFSYLHEHGVTVPLVADIHFDYRAALESVAAGADKIRINPGNIGDDERVRAVAEACRGAGVPIRIGVNGGSLEHSILAKYGAPTSEALCESALYHASLLEKFDFSDIVISVKSSNARTMIGAYRILAERTEYPLHLGVTEAGTRMRGTVKNAVGIGSLLCDGIGDTIRVSLTSDPEDEVLEGIRLLDLLGLRESGIELVSCPTCGRTRVDLISLADEFERRIVGIKPSRRLKVAVMGCAVNGPGEAKDADFGVACGDGCGLIFSGGVTVGKVGEDEIIDTLIYMCEHDGAVPSLK